MRNLAQANLRVLVIDDQESIHNDFQNILAPPDIDDAALDTAAEAFFNEKPADHATTLRFLVESAFQGQQGFEMVRNAVRVGQPYAVAFVDMRMPPGWDGVETIQHLWEADPDLEVVICTAYTDYSWDETAEKLGRSNHLLILKKPFDNAEILQLAHALTEKWSLGRQAQAKLQEIHALIDSQTRDLIEANEQLSKAKEAAEVATRSKTAFLANMSHEIRTPMTSILGFADKLLDSGLSESERLHATLTIRRNGHHLLGIINDILDISKIEAGKLEIEMIECSPVEIVAEVHSLMLVRSESKNLGLLAEFTGPIPERIRTDPTRLRQILTNLVGNAIKFTDQGKVCIKVHLVGQHSSCPSLQFDVVDTGIGIDQKHIERLFQPFVQADASTTRKYGGSGLGLVISRRLAQMLGGDIEVSSKMGEGSVFSLRIDTGTLDGIAMIQNPDITTATARVSEDETRPARLQEGCRILLAEDGEDNQDYIAYVLEKAGAVVDVVEHGALAVDAVNRSISYGNADGSGHGYDLVLMDMQMPVMDGYQATRKLRQDGYNGKIVALTAHAMSADREKCLTAGCDDYLPKPIDRPSLLAMVAKHTCDSVVT